MGLKKQSKLKITPIGGFGEIGANMVLVEGEESKIIIDAGIQFPSDQAYNLQFLIPNFELYPLETFTDLFVTHAHEDHIGAIPFLLKKYPHLKVHASSFACQLIEEKIRFYGYSSLHEDTLQPFTIDEEFSFAEFRLKIIAVEHSIPETCGFLLQDFNHQLSLFYASDFKSIPDTKELTKAFKKSSFRLCFMDSTNILSTKADLSESDVAKSLQVCLQKISGRCFITFFPSNIFRLQSLLNIAQKLKKRVVFHGKSLSSYYSPALKIGLLKHSSLIVDSEDINPEDDDLMILLTGCQGDYKGALARVVSTSDPLFKIKQNDTFIFSSKTIPGNEKRIAKIINNIYQQGGNVITPEHKNPIHASGHCSPDILVNLYKTLHPTHVIPVHGETYFLYKHQELVHKHFKNIKIPLLGNHQQLTLSWTNNDLQYETKEAPTPLPFPLFALSDGIIISKEKINERRRISFHGALFISIHEKNKHIIIDSVGIPLDKAVIENEVYSLVNNKFHNLTVEKIDDFKVALRKKLAAIIKDKPQVFVHLH